MLSWKHYWFSLNAAFFFSFLSFPRFSNPKNCILPAPPLFFRGEILMGTTGTQIDILSLFLDILPCPSLRGQNLSLRIWKKKLPIYFIYFFLFPILSLLYEPQELHISSSPLVLWGEILMGTTGTLIDILSLFLDIFPCPSLRGQNLSLRIWKKKKLPIYGDSFKQEVFMAL